jgi:hypothetical protein
MRVSEIPDGGVAMTVWRKKYLTYLHSEAWNEMREAVMWLRGGKCERCGAAAQELHHKTYERLGRELPADIELLCHDCHVVADKERAARGEAHAADTRYSRGLETYASKKYGDGWDRYGEQEVAEEFDAWLERQ